MQNIYHKSNSRVISILLLLVMGINLLSLFTFKSYGTEDNSEDILLRVVDKEGTVVSGATVEYKVEEELEGIDDRNVVLVETVETNDKGEVGLFKKGQFNRGLYLSVRVSKEGYFPQSFEKRIEEEEVNINIELESVPRSEDFIIVVNENLAYTGEEHLLIDRIEGIEEGDEIEYKLDGGNWTTEKPVGVAAGVYHVEVKVIRGLLEIELESKQISISKASQRIKFKNYREEEEIMVQGLFPVEGKRYDFSVENYNDEAELVGQTFTYSVEADEGEQDIVAIDATSGELTVFGSGKFRVRAILHEENSNYSGAVVECLLTVKQQAEFQGQFIEFENLKVDYVFKLGSYVTLQNVRNKLRKSKNITYSIDNSGIGISCDAKTGEIMIESHELLSHALEEMGGELDIKVIARLEEDEFVERISRENFADQAFYTLHVVFGEIPGEPYSLEGMSGENSWYISDVIVTPKDGYKISMALSSESFSDNIILNDTTQLERKIYLLEENTQNIIKPILLEGIKIDTIRPDSSLIEIHFSEPISNQQIQGKEYKFYKELVKIDLVGVDANSGISEFYWQYNREESVSETNLEVDNGVVIAEQNKDDKTKYRGSFVLPKEIALQMRGRMSVNAKDTAGLHSDAKDELNKLIVIDNIKPIVNVIFQPLQSTRTKIVGDRSFYSGSMEASIFLTEANFFAEDVEVILTQNESSRKLENLLWEKTEKKDEYKAKVVLTEEAEYRLTVSYQDRSGNEMDVYQSDLQIIDKTAPKIFFQYYNHTDKEKPQVVKITVEEKYFDPLMIGLQTNVTDITGKEIISNDLQSILRKKKWTAEGNAYSTEVERELLDGIYVLKIDCVDFAENRAKQLNTEKFVVDRTPVAPADLVIDYSMPITEKVFSDITFGFYNPTVTVTVSARDYVSGVDYFVWSYLKQKDESNSNVYSYPDTILTALQDENDKSHFSASFTLPKDKAEQLRGNITFVAMDRAGNLSDKKTDNNRIIIVDTIAPKMEVEYTSPINVKENKMFYNSMVGVQFKVTESNFYEEDVKVEISKNGGAPIAAKINWFNESVDKHIGKLVLEAMDDHSKDGDYTIFVTYKDKSGNQMHNYVSDTIVIDTTRPFISVSYSDEEPTSSKVDSEGNLRDYFNKVQIATVKITEHNFSKKEVELKVAAKDILGNNLNAQELVEISEWKSFGDEHTLIVTYFGDANYSFDVSYIDLAQNKSEIRQTDYFSVDKLVPSKLQISYSESLMERVFETITFGYYNAKLMVEVEAEDDISGVDGFRYRYRKGTSESEEFSISEQEIVFSGRGERATAKFQVPHNLVQFNDVIDFYAVDRAGNASEFSSDNKNLIVDTIAPNVVVQYNAPVLKEGNISFYSSEILVSILVTEENFYPEDIVVSLVEGEKVIPVNVAWSVGLTGRHQGRFSLIEDGDYYVTISYTDRSQNKMEEYRSQQLTIDTKIEEATILVNDVDPDGKSFKDEVISTIRFADKNFESYSIKIFRSNLDEIEQDVTEDFLTENITLNSNGGQIVLDKFERIFENDGVYTILVQIRDKAAHEIIKKSTFSINRFGSVYKYNEYLNNLILNGGSYVQEISEDLVIEEYNASQLLPGSLDVIVSLDGKPLEKIEYTERQLNKDASETENAWNRYEYLISKDNFSKEGLYKIAVSSKDEAGNTPENNNYKDKVIQFHVDRTAPEINSIIGLEKPIINEVEAEIKYVVYDTMGLSSIAIYLSGQEIEKITEFHDDKNQFVGSFSIKENSVTQDVRLVVEDLAGNITDTQESNFSSKFAFNSKVTVSTNAFVRFYADKKMFWATIATALVSMSGIGGYGFMLKRK